MSNIRTIIFRIAIMLTTLAACVNIHAEPIKAAVASNFAEAARNLARIFEEETGSKVLISSASTGKLYAQIVNGAPFDIFLSADAARPEKLVKDGLANASTLRTYANGQLMMVSDIPTLDADCKSTLHSPDVTRIAIAEPKIAPYGKAAQEALKKMELWQSLKQKLVRGENVSQTLHFYVTGNAQIAFVAHSQAHLLTSTEQCSWVIPQSMHSPIEQKMVLLNNASTQASAFAEFLTSPRIRQLISSYGYQLD